MYLKNKKLSTKCTAEFSSNFLRTLLCRIRSKSTKDLKYRKLQRELVWEQGKGRTWGTSVPTAGNVRKISAVCPKASLYFSFHPLLQLCLLIPIQENYSEISSNDNRKWVRRNTWRVWSMETTVEIVRMSSCCKNCMPSTLKSRRDTVNTAKLSSRNSISTRSAQIHEVISWTCVGHTCTVCFFLNCPLKQMCENIALLWHLKQYLRKLCLFEPDLEHICGAKPQTFLSSGTFCNTSEQRRKSPRRSCCAKSMSVYSHLDNIPPQTLGCHLYYLYWTCHLS